MKDIIYDDFQNRVDESLLRHKSVLDILTKLEESQARINRAVIKSVTNCGCIKIAAHKQEMPEDMDIDNIRKYLETHIDGKLCDNCREIIEKELGNNLFYMASLCNVLDLNLYDIILKEYNRVKTLGKYSLK